APQRDGRRPVRADRGAPRARRRHAPVRRRPAPLLERHGRGHRTVARCHARRSVHSAALAQRDRGRPMKITRRTLLGSSLAALAAKQTAAQPAHQHPPEHQHPTPTPTPTPAPPAPPAPPISAPTQPPYPGIPGHRVVVPNGTLLPWTTQRGVKVYHLRTETLRHQIAPGLDIEAWGYNGSTPGPLIEAVVGDRVRIYVTNHLPEPTSIHWHGILVP